MGDVFKLVKLIDSISLNITNGTVLDNIAATAPPTATDDVNAGYTVGSHWIDTTNDEAYICVDSTASAAVWEKVTTHTGLGSSTDNAVSRYDGTTGDIQDSGVLIDDSDNVYTPMSFQADDRIEAGDPGLETSGVTINGNLFATKLRANDIGGTAPAQLMLHRHSTTLFSALVGARANSDTSTHAAVTNSVVE